MPERDTQRSPWSAAGVLADAAHDLRRAFGEARGRLGWWVRRGFGRVDREIVARCRASATPRRLHLGCGLDPLPGWLNCDLFPPQRDVLHLDVRRRFPFDDGTFDAIYSQHLIEHLSYADGARKLAECHRVLRPGGVLRLATPDLAFLLALGGERPSGLQQAYVRRATELYYPGAPAPAAGFAINNFFRNWGHRFIYDEGILRRSLALAGFGEIARVELNASRHEALRGLENEARLPPGFLRLETLVLEAVK